MADNVDAVEFEAGKKFHTINNFYNRALQERLAYLFHNLRINNYLK